MSFSKRFNLNKTAPLQIEGISANLRHDLWNPIYLILWDFDTKNFKNPPSVLDILNSMGVHIDSTMGQLASNVLFIIKEQFFSISWEVIYDLIEKIAQQVRGGEFNISINEVLEKHNSAYRLKTKEIIRIVDPVTLLSIEEVKNNPKLVDTVKEELARAIHKLSERGETKSPYCYNESAEAAIHMLEAYFKEKTGESTLSKAVALLKKQKKIETTFSAVFEKLYAFSNDQLRHAIKPESKQVVLEYSDALFILHQSLALVNYLECPGQLFKLADQLESKQL